LHDFLVALYFTIPSISSTQAHVLWLLVGVADGSCTVSQRGYILLSQK